jgi:hypothetical protein
MAIGPEAPFNQPGMGPHGPLSPNGIQQQAQRRVPNQGAYNGNPRGANNMPMTNRANPQAPSWQQQQNLGRYRPPTMSGTGGGRFNTNTWNDDGGYDYNLPGSFGSPQGNAQFAPMLRQFQQFFPGNMGSNPFGPVGGFAPQFGGMGGGMGPQQGPSQPSPNLRDNREQPQPQAPKAPSWTTGFLNSLQTAQQRYGDQGGGGDGMAVAPSPEGGVQGAPPMNSWDDPSTMNYNMMMIRRMLGGRG